MFIPSKKSNKEDIINEQHQLRDLDIDTAQTQEKILNFLINIPASYIAEIAWETQTSEYYLKNAISILERDGYVKHLRVNPDVPDIRLLMRVPDQSAVGQGGTANFSKKRWFVITDKGRDKVRGIA